MFKDAMRRRFDVRLVWSMYRHVAQAMAELDAAGVALISGQQGIDGTGPFGRAIGMFRLFSQWDFALWGFAFVAQTRAEG
jgi:DNA invertase Pin-like site-specific DNA recombinase